MAVIGIGGQGYLLSWLARRLQQLDDCCLMESMCTYYDTDSVFLSRESTVVEGMGSWRTDLGLSEVEVLIGSRTGPATDRLARLKKAESWGSPKTRLRGQGACRISPL